MTGYRNNPKANEEVFFYHRSNGQRYFRTGDMGRLVEGKFLKITGRIKEQFKLENGKFIVSLADGSYSGSNANIAILVKAAMKKKFPEEMAYFQFTEEKANLDDMMNMSGKDYIDSQDSML